MNSKLSFPKSTSSNKRNDSLEQNALLKIGIPKLTFKSENKPKSGINENLSSLNISEDFYTKTNKLIVNNGFFTSNQNRAVDILQLSNKTAQINSSRAQKAWGDQSSVNKQISQISPRQVTAPQNNLYKIFSASKSTRLLGEEDSLQDLKKVQHSQAYIMAMRALQDKIKQMEEEISSKNNNNADQIMQVLENLEQNKKKLQEYQEKEKVQNQTLSDLTKKNQVLQSKNSELEKCLKTKTNEMNQLYQDLLSNKYSSNNQFLVYNRGDRSSQLKKIKGQIDLTNNDGDKKYISEQQLYLQTFNERQRVNENLEQQLAQQNLYQNEIKILLENQKVDETLRYLEIIEEQRFKIQSLESQLRKVENQVKDYQNSKIYAEKAFENYKEQVPQYKFQDLEKQIQNLEKSMREKEKKHILQIQDIMEKKKVIEDQLHQRIQQLINQNSDHQSQIHQLSLDCQKLAVENESLQEKIERAKLKDELFPTRQIFLMEKLFQRKSRISERRSNHNSFHQQELNTSAYRIKRRSPDSFSAPHTSIPFNMERQFAHESRGSNMNVVTNNQSNGMEERSTFDELNFCTVQNKSQQNPTYIYPEFKTQNTSQKRTVIFNNDKSQNSIMQEDIIQSPHSSIIQFDRELQKKIQDQETLVNNINEEYEQIARQAQLEEDTKVKSSLRHQLIGLADKIKQQNNQLIKLQQQSKTEEAKAYRQRKGY